MRYLSLFILLFVYASCQTGTTTALHMNRSHVKRKKRNKNRRSRKRNNKVRPKNKKNPKDSSTTSSTGSLNLQEMEDFIFENGGLQSFRDEIILIKKQVIAFLEQKKKVNRLLIEFQQLRKEAQSTIENTHQEDEKKDTTIDGIIELKAQLLNEELKILAQQSPDMKNLKQVKASMDQRMNSLSKALSIRFGIDESFFTGQNGPSKSQSSQIIYSLQQLSLCT